MPKMPEAMSLCRRAFSQYPKGLRGCITPWPGEGSIAGGEAAADQALQGTGPLATPIITKISH